MKKFYSIATRGFYPSTMRADYDAVGTWQADAVEVSAADEAEIRSVTAAGGTVSGGPGAWIVTPAPAEPISSILARAIIEIKKQRAGIMNALDGISGRMYRAGEIDVSESADSAIRALLDITALPALLTATTYDEMKAAVLARYREIVAASPPAVQSAFIEAVSP